MIYEVKMFAGKCDNCGVEVMQGSDYSAYGDEAMVENEMMDLDWIESDGKDICCDCHSLDDNDNIIIDKSRKNLHKNK